MKNQVWEKKSIPEVLKKQQIASILFDVVLESSDTVQMCDGTDSCNKEFYLCYFFWLKNPEMFPCIIKESDPEVFADKVRDACLKIVESNGTV